MQDGGAVGSRRGYFTSLPYGFIPARNTRRGEEQLVRVLSHRLISAIGVFFKLCTAALLRFFYKLAWKSDTWMDE